MTRLFLNAERLPVMVLGLCGEAGEVADLVKEHLWHGKDYPHAEIKNELGDALGYVSEIATALGLTLEDIAAANIEKLRRRYPDGFAVGGGIDDLCRVPRLQASRLCGRWRRPEDRGVAVDALSVAGRDCALGAEEGPRGDLRGLRTWQVLHADRVGARLGRADVDSSAALCR